MDDRLTNGRTKTQGLVRLAEQRAVGTACMNELRFGGGEDVGGNADLFGDDTR